MNESEKIATLQAVCHGITSERASELLEAANGNMERAVDIFFHQKQESDEEYVEHGVIVDGPKPVKRSNHPDTSPSTTVDRTDVASSSVARASPFATKMKRSPSNEISLSATACGRKQARLDLFFDAKQPPIPVASASHGAIPTQRNDEILEIDDSDDAITNENMQLRVGVTMAKTSSLVPCLKENTNKDGGPEPTSAATTTEVSFECLAETLQQLADTTKRLVKLDVLKKFINHILQQDQLESCRAQTLVCALLLFLGFRGGNQQAPMEVGGSALTKALQVVLGASRTQLSKGYRQYGDIGDAAASLFQKRTFFVTTSAKPLTIRHVYESFDKIVTTDGREAKQRILLQLLRACNSKVEIRFLVRLLIGNMRVGANLKTVLAALAMTFAPEEEIKIAVEIVQKTYDVCPDLNAIVTALLKGGVKQVQKDCTIQLLTPIAPMLAHPIHSLEQVAKAMAGDDGHFNSMIMEWKYDGVRCQAHYDGTTIKLFSRHMLETTAQYPDAARAILAARIDGNNRVQSFILDAEIVGVEGEGEDMRLLPFQDLSRRKKNDDGQGVQIKVFCFDLMYLNGESYINQSLGQRQAKLKECFEAANSNFAFVSSQPLDKFDKGRICTFLEEAVQKGAEGLMLKMLGAPVRNIDDEASEIGEPVPKSTSPYEAGTRSHSWLKIKRDYVSGYADTIDVVPIGAWYGSGRKAQKSFLSPVLLAVYDEDDDVYRSISRCMSFTDAMYDAMREFYFHGTAYPPAVGMEGGTFEKHDQSPAQNELEPLEDGEEEVKSDEDEGDNQSNDAMANTETGESRVNCFSSRPSSAYVVTNESPPIWFKPMEVFEVSFADLSLSRQHTAGAGHVGDPEGRGVALRFPRFKRRRPDKKPEQATTSLQIAQLFQQQSKQASNTRRSAKCQ